MHKVNIEEILPHRFPMLMVSDVIEKADANIMCYAVVDAHNPFLNDGELPSFVCLELVAQAAGIFLGMSSTDEAAPSSGAIVAVRDMKIKPQTIQQDMSLEVRADFLGGNQQAAMFSGEVLLDGYPLFQTKVTVALFNEVSDG